jgi:hypothetical protein
MAFARYKGEAENVAVRGAGEGRALVLENRNIQHLAGGGASIAFDQVES